MRIFFSRSKKKLFFTFCVFFFPCILFIFLGLFLIPFEHSYKKEIIAFSLFGFNLYVLSILFNLNKKTTLFLISILSFICWLKLSVYSIFGSKLSTSAFYTLLETNQKESIEFLKTYLQWDIIIGFIFLCSYILFAYKFYFKTKFYSPIILKVFSALCIVCSTYTIRKYFRNEDLFFKSYSSTINYINFKNKRKSVLSRVKSPYIHIDNSIKKESPETHIVIIGESTARNHLQLYGYSRKTNPLLSKIKKELYLFKDVISPNASTLKSLDKILTLNTHSSQDVENNASIVQLANASNYKTYWISNQEAYGVTETAATVIASACNKKYFLTSDNYSYDIHDMNILPKLEEVLNDNTPKKIIFIHLIGTHAKYNRRYPEEFNVFKNTVPPNQKFVKEGKHVEVINEYDNAVRYNDYVVSSIVEKLKAKKHNSFLCYFSDHGEEVYDTSDYIGHWESNDLTSKIMFDIPFVLWFSKSYKNENLLDIDEIVLNRKYNLEDFFHTFSDLIGISSNKTNNTRSILSKDFEYKKREIYNGIYDSIP